MVSEQVLQAVGETAQRDTNTLKTHAKISTSSRKKVLTRAKNYNYAHYKLKLGGLQ